LQGMPQLPFITDNWHYFVASVPRVSLELLGSYPQTYPILGSKVSTSQEMVIYFRPPT
jgi:hypothetical protein